jgi:hypothetical protein
MSNINTLIAVSDLANIREQISSISDEVQASAGFRAAAFQTLSGYLLPAFLQSESVNILSSSESAPALVSHELSIQYLRSAMQQISTSTLADGSPLVNVLAFGSVFSPVHMLWMNLQPGLPGGLLDTSTRVLELMLEDELRIFQAVILLAVLIIATVLLVQGGYVVIKLWATVSQLDEVSSTAVTALAKLPPVRVLRHRREALRVLQSVADDSLQEDGSKSAGPEEVQMSRLKAQIQMLAMDDSDNKYVFEGNETGEASCSPNQTVLRQRATSTGRDTRAWSQHSGEHSLDHVPKTSHMHRASLGSSQIETASLGSENSTSRVTKSHSLWKVRCCGFLPSIVLLLTFLYVVLLMQSCILTSASAVRNHLAVHGVCTALHEHFDSVVDLVHLRDMLLLSKSPGAQLVANQGGLNLSQSLYSQDAAMLRTIAAETNLRQTVDRVMFGGALQMRDPTSAVPFLATSPPSSQLLQTGISPFMLENACTSIEKPPASFGIAPISAPLARASPTELPGLANLYFQNCSSADFPAASTGFAGSVQFSVLIAQAVVQAVRRQPSNLTAIELLRQDVQLAGALSYFIELDSSVLRPACSVLVQRADAGFDALDAQFWSLCLFIATLLPVTATVLCCIALPHTDAFAARALHSLSLLLLLEKDSLTARDGAVSSDSALLPAGGANGPNCNPEYEEGKGVLPPAPAPSLSSLEHPLLTKLRRFYTRTASSSGRPANSATQLLHLDDGSRSTGSSCANYCRCSCDAPSCLKLRHIGLGFEQRARANSEWDNSGGYDSADSFSDTEGVFD